MTAADTDGTTPGYPSRSNRTTDVPPPTEMPDKALVVSDFTGNTDKIERHIGPLAAVADETTMVCLTPNRDLDTVEYVTVPSIGFRPLSLVVLFVVALVEGVRNDYDAIVCFSLLPYGCFGLCLRPLVGAPVHLGIIGADLDLHAVSWYGPAVRTLFCLFDSVSVPGEQHRRRLVGMGVPPHRVTVLTNAIDSSVYRPPDGSVEREYDFVWAGRFSEEKDPVAFVRSLALLRERGHDFRAVMLGDGHLEPEVAAAIDDAGLSDAVELAGWVEEPVEYYRRSRVFALTSSRDALALSLLEAMATGLACVAPAVGNTADVVDHRENGFLLPDADETSLADSFEALLRDPTLRDRLGKNAATVRPRFSYARAREDWERISRVLAGRCEPGNSVEPFRVNRADD